MFLPQRTPTRPAFAVSVAAHAAFVAALVGPPLFALPSAPEWEGNVRILSLPRAATDAPARVTVDLPSNEKNGGGAAAPPRRASGRPARSSARPVPPRGSSSVLPDPRAGDEDDSSTFEETGEQSEPLLGPGGRGGGAGEGGAGGCEGCGVISANAAGVTPPVALETVSPVYPELARKVHVEGVVVLEAIIGSDGSVRDARILRSTSPLLEAAALEAVRRWRYEPARIGTRPVPVYLSVVVTFALRNL